MGSTFSFGKEMALILFCLMGLTSNVFSKPEHPGSKDTSGLVIPIYLQIWHDRISEEQQIVDALDGSVDKKVTISGDPATSEAATKAIFEEVDKLRLSLEFSSHDKRTKIFYLNAVQSVLNLLNGKIKQELIAPRDIPLSIHTFLSMIKADQKGESVAPFLKDIPYHIAEINILQFKQNVGYREARKNLLIAYARKYPENFLSALNREYSEFIEDNFVDTLIAGIAPEYPLEIYNYVTSYTDINNKIRANKDPLVKAITMIGDSPRALRMLPFVDYIVDSTYTIEELRKISMDEDAFYSLSVKTLIDMNKKEIRGDAPVGLKQMQNNVTARAMRYIRKVNELHESSDNVRFAISNRLSAQEIYYVLINGQEEIYTSSFTGLYKRMMSKMKPQKGDAFLMSVVFDHFRKFITLSAAYNTLDPFLRTLEAEHANILMRKFVSGLEKSEGLEDAVDVADAFASIKDPQLLKDLREQINVNFNQMQVQNNERGKVIYGLLSTLFKDKSKSGEASDWAEQMSRDLNLPPMDRIPFEALANPDGRIYQEIFFYGDKDGFASYRSFMSGFSSAGWKIEHHKYWVKLSSRGGTPITIFAKKPMDTEDEKGMAALRAHLDEQNITPTVYIHRGHSYHVDASIAQLQTSAKLVFLGSCGGYNSLASVLNVSPDAQIITSKQTGATSINEPIIHSILSQMQVGNDLQWETIWSQLDNRFKGSPYNYQMFQDYIPPQENLGALFIKAYKRVMEANNMNSELDKGV